MNKVGLVLGGGGRNGAFAVGAIYRLTSQYNLSFDYISGTSTGALMTTFVLLDEIEDLNDIYRGGISNDDILNSRGLISGFFNGALSSTTPLSELINRYMDKESVKRAWENNKKAVVTCVNIRTGSIVRRWSNPDDLGDWEKYVLASASIPVLMDPVEIDNDLYVDGGLVENIPVNPLLDKDLDTIIVITNNPLETAHLEENPSGVKDILLRTIDVMLGEITRNDVPDKCAMAGKKLITISPDKYLGDSLDFNSEKMEKIWLAGFDKCGIVMDEVITE